MSIIVEDGSNVPGANSYVSLIDARVILNLLGQDLDANDVTAEQQLLNSMTYIEAFRAKYKGQRTERNQPLQWPRIGVCIDDFVLDTDVIPQELIDAQVFAAYEFSTGVVLQPTVTGQVVQSEEVVGAVKVSYFDTRAVEGSFNLVRVLDSLNPLFETAGFVMRGMRG